jgi:hypothetical protein
MKKVHINMGPKNPPFRVRALFLSDMLIVIAPNIVREFGVSLRRAEEKW